MIGFKLFRKRKDGTYGPLFINKKQKLLKTAMYKAEDHPTKGYAHRPGWHICEEPSAPHLSYKNRVWCQVWFDDNYETIQRPEAQGGKWFICNGWMSILKEVDHETPTNYFKPVY